VSICRSRSVCRDKHSIKQTAKHELSRQVLPNFKY